MFRIKTSTPDKKYPMANKCGTTECRYCPGNAAIECPTLGCDWSPPFCVQEANPICPNDGAKCQ